MAVEMIRINTRVSPEMMEWIEKRTEETGIPKSTIIMLALEEYRKQHQALDMVTVLGDLVERLHNIESELSNNKISGM